MKALENNIKRIIWVVVAILIVISFFTMPQLIEQSHRVNAAIGLSTGLISFLGMRLVVVVEDTFKKHTNEN